ncbi:hypothetical protein ABXM62_12945 [Enterococcus faecium]
MNKMKNLIAGGFLFVGGGILMNTDNFENVIPFSWCSLCFDWCRNADLFRI